MKLIVGTGLIAEEYIRCLQYLNENFDVVGRSLEKSSYISNKYNINCISGGIEEFKPNDCYTNIIIATPIVNLYNHLKICLTKFKNLDSILIEKPGCLYLNQIEEIIKLRKSVKIQIAYNRRFYSSVLNAKEIIKNDKVVNMELCIDEYQLEEISKIYDNELMQNYCTIMTSHVIDAAFDLIGKPKELNCQVKGENLLSYHKSGCFFEGNGISQNNIKFNYHGDWSKSGKWKIDLFLESGKRLSFQPLEDLKIINSDNYEEIIKRDQIDADFKPGFLRQTEAFLRDSNKLKTLEEQLYDIKNIYNKMVNYNKFNVLIIGLGNIGFRHLQALINTKYDINYHLVEILDENITRCKTYLLENDINTFNFYKDINSIDVEKLNLVISATCANIRLKLLKNLFDNKSIKSIENIVLEKIIFTEKNEFGLFEEMIDSRVSLDNVYCSSDWDNRFKFKYLEEKYNVSKGKIHINGSWSLGCNSIHAIMMLLKYFEFNSLETNNIQIKESKRNNYKEINGKLSNENIIIESQDSKEFSLNIDICVDNYLIFITYINDTIIFDIKQEKVLICIRILNHLQY
jgi:predicted dehydrogenase